MNRLLVLAAAVIGWCVVVGCDKAPQPASDPPKRAEAGGIGTPPEPAASSQQKARKHPEPPKEIARVAVIELYESHRDTFAEPLGEATQFAADHADALVTLTKQGLLLDAAVARAIESGKRDYAGLQVAKDVERLDQARLVVVYRTLFGGVGRQGGSVRYLVFGRLPASIPLPPANPAGARWELDIATDGPLPLAARAITGYPPELKELQLAESPQDKQLLLSLGETSKVLPPDQPVEMTTASRTVAVGQKAIVADIEGQQGLEVIPARDLGSITFTTRLMAIYRGEQPLSITSSDGAPAAQAKEKTP